MTQMKRAASLALVFSSTIAVPVIAAPQRVPNRQPYRVTRNATVTGRTGSATVSARALLDRDQHTSLEIIAGEFDPVPAAVGTLAKIQVKSYDGNGDSLFTLNYGGLDAPRVTLSYDGLAHGQAIEVQSNVRNLDKNRTDVVTVTSVVRRRPDLTVQSILAPARAIVGTFVHITATVAELNYDTGARATCALFVDDVAVDRAEGIWVDAGDTVSCAFTHVFDGQGMHGIRVTAADVNPDDWNPDNNSAASTIAIVTGEQAFDSVSAQAGEWSRRHSSHESMYARSSDSSGDLVWTSENRSDDVNDQQAGEYHAYFRGLMQFPLTQLSVAQWTDDRVIHQALFTSVAAQRVWNAGACSQLYDSDDQSIYLDVCTSFNPGEPPFSTLRYGRFAGTVTFYASHYEAAWYETPEGTVPVYSYSYNISTGGPFGTRVPLGDTYRFEVTIISGGIAYGLPVSMTLPPMQVFTDINRPWTCTDSSYPPLLYRRYCDELIDYNAGRMNWFSKP
jgi:hypothetical protein